MALGLGLGEGKRWDPPERMSRGRPDMEAGFFLNFQHFRWV